MILSTVDRTRHQPQFRGAVMERGRRADISGVPVVGGGQEVPPEAFFGVPPGGKTQKWQQPELSGWRLVICTGPGGGGFTIENQYPPNALARWLQRVLLGWKWERAV